MVMEQLLQATTTGVTARASMILLQLGWPHLQKKPKTRRHIIPHKVKKIIESDMDNYGVYDDDDETLFTKAAKLLSDRDPLAVE